jgi:hypothetical protein
MAQGRHRAMPHIKSYVRAAEDGEVAWCIITSANLSNSAWGQLQLKDEQLQIRHYELGCLFTPTHYARALQILKQRRQVNFTCTPKQPIIYSPKGDRSKLPYFIDEDHASKAAAAASSAAASSAPSSEALPPLPLPPAVRFVLLPPKPTYQAGMKRKVPSHAEEKQEEGDEREQAKRSKRSASSSAATQRTASSADVSTVVLTPASASTSASSESELRDRVLYTVICPLPYNVIDPKPYGPEGSHTHTARIHAPIGPVLRMVYVTDVTRVFCVCLVHVLFVVR